MMMQYDEDGSRPLAWLPVLEKPRRDGWYVVLIGNPYPDTAYCIDGEWTTPFANVTHWLPILIPELPEVDNG